MKIDRLDAGRPKPQKQLNSFYAMRWMNDKLYLTQTEYIIAYIPIQSYKYGRQFQQQQRFFLNAKANLGVYARNYY